MRRFDLMLAVGLALAEGRELLTWHEEFPVAGLKEYISRSLVFREAQQQKKEKWMKAAVLALSILASLAIVVALLT